MREPWPTHEVRLRKVTGRVPWRIDAPDEQWSNIVAAVQTWANCGVDVSVVEVDDDSANVGVELASFQGSTLGQYWHTTTPPRARIRLSKQYRLDRFRPGSYAWTVAMHEGGHAFDLVHTLDDYEDGAGNQPYVMDPTLDEAYEAPQERDVEALAAIYGWRDKIYVYRAYDPSTNSHRFVTDRGVRNGWAQQGVQYEGVAFEVVSGAPRYAVLRHYGIGDTLVTQDQGAEHQYLLTIGWQLVCAFPSSDAIRRFYCPSTNRHHATRGQAEIAALQADPLWTDEGVL